MKDFSQLLADRTETITAQWVEAVVRDRLIASTNDLSRNAIRDHIPHVLEAMVTVLAEDQTNDVEAITQVSFLHGALRAEQGFDPTEIVREYHLLRTLILTNLQDELLKGTTIELFRAMSLISAVVDAAIAQCFKSYVQERVRELEQLQSQLTLTVQELNRLIRANQENLSMLAHELKTPLNSIIGYAELFLRQQRRIEVKDTAPNIDHIERVLRNGRQLLHLINDALELARSDANKIQAHPALVDVQEILQAVVEVIQPLVDARSLKFVLACDNAPEEVLTDGFRLQQVLINLLSNAIRYTEAGSITLACRSLENDTWEVAVTDTGIGIAVEEQSQIFEPFYQVTSPRQPPLPDSTGLGLAIVAQLVKLLQGEIHLTSQVGMGSTFAIILPQTMVVDSFDPQVVALG
ncbi:HAMP domain-containing histidine kinase [Phormidium sp. CLA17]|uniref:sensor histidine kinase n=1 Tax=Leptolyngbya sp. Cla-17 TaxID=2803751 RepID=UPI00149224FB|nr:HAMP domain-containing sensor histidine kinase [Leptolyngbya sp. Cla-17]MBM0743379.1 HAMP domain-containing histidine kinase [Leptolyngbya sp. Cla-17]